MWEGEQKIKAASALFRGPSAHRARQRFAAVGREWADCGPFLALPDSGPECHLSSVRRAAAWCAAHGGGAVLSPRYGVANEFGRVGGARESILRVTPEGRVTFADREVRPED